jgi:hypothetical protein
LNPRTSLAALALAVAFGCTVSVPSARAAGPDAKALSESDRLIGQALDLREAGKDKDALPLLERAVTLDANPRARAQLALGQQAMGAWIDAEHGLESVLESTDDAWVQQNRATLEQALATTRRQLGWIEVEASVQGAQVTLDGAEVGAVPLPGPIRVPAGVSSLKVAAPGYAPAVRLVQVVAGEHAREVIALQPELANVRLAVASAEVAHQDVIHVPPPDEETAADESKARRGPLTWILLAGGAVALAGGAAASVVREEDAATYNREAAAFNSACDPQCPSARPSHSTVDLFMGLSIAGYATGAALGASAAILLLRPRSRHASSARASSACGVGGLGVSCGWTF